MTPADAVSLALVGAVALTLPVFAAVSRGRARDADVARRPRTALLGFWIRDWVMWLIGPFERAFVRSRAAPELFNVAGVALGIAAGAGYAGGALALGGWLVLAGGLCDILDGRIARARGTDSARGAFLDSTLDRFAETFAFTGIVLYFSPRPALAAAAALALGGSLLVSYARARGEGLGVSCRGGLMQRAERLVLLAAASLLDAPAAALAGWPPGALLAGALAVIAAGALGTAAYRTATIARALRGGGAPDR